MASKKPSLHPRAALAVAEWLSSDSLAREKLAEKKIELSRVEALTKSNCPEETLSFVETQLTEVSGINFRDLYVQIAKDQLTQEQWSGADRLPEITCHAQIGSTLQEIHDALESSKPLLAALGVKGSFLRKLFYGTTRGTVNRLKRVLMVIYCHKNNLPLPVAPLASTARGDKPNQKPGRPRKGKPAKSAGSPEANLNQTSIREVAVSILSMMTTQLGLMEKVLAQSGQDVLVDGDRMRTIRIIIRLLKAFGITSEVITRLKNPTPLTRDDPLFEPLRQFAIMASRKEAR